MSTQKSMPSMEQDFKLSDILMTPEMAWSVSFIAICLSALMVFS